MNSFEDKLMLELESVVAEREHSATAIGRRRFGWKPRLVLAGLAGGALAVGAAIGLPGGQPPAAWAVTANPDGSLKVEIHELTDADGLERELAKRGIRADVTYLGKGKVCAQGRDRWTRSNSPGAARFKQRNGFGEWGWVVRSDDLGPNDTLVLELQDQGAFDPAGDGSGIYGTTGAIASGEVGACEAVDGDVNTEIFVKRGPRSDEPSPGTRPSGSPRGPSDKQSGKQSSKVFVPSR